MKKSRWLSVLLVVVLVLSLCSSAFAVEAEDTDNTQRLYDSLENPRSESLQIHGNGKYKPGDQVRLVVLMDGEPAADKQGNFKRSSAEANLMVQHSNVKQSMDNKQIAYSVNFEYTSLLNGMSITVDYADIDKVASLPGVVDVFIPAEYKVPVLQPNADSASEMIGATDLGGAIGADGSGKVIAVIDTGITANHEAFGVYPGMLQTPAWEKVDMIKTIAGIGHGAYYSQKIPYQYDYADQDNDALDDGSSHGSHVSGIAAGYVATDEGVVTFRGSAPDAQILAMKVFASASPTTSSDIYFAALEDAYKLGADVVNMSLGAPNGFVEDAESVLNDRIYERLENAGVICCISAGNEANMGEYSQNWLGAGYVTADYADYGVLGSPASYNGNVAVASIENEVYPAYTINVNGQEYDFRDPDGEAFHSAFSGQDVEYVLVPDLGVAEAYESIDVRGKIAVISRGEITFEDKVAYASAAGAAGVVIYDNADGALITMAITTKTIPAIFVSKACGAALLANEGNTFLVNAEKTNVENPEAWNMSSFSSWGPTNDLQIKPTITGVGGNVNSALAGTTDQYEVASGTSMSAPNVSGGYATLLEAITNDNPEMSKAEAAALARNRTLSHAFVDYVFAQNEDGSYYGVPYSPRQQGAGVLDVAAAYHATLAITDPLAELGDDPAKTGVFTITSDLENTGAEERTYYISAHVLTDTVTGGYIDGQLHVFNALQPMLLEEGVDYTIDAPETVTLAAGEKKTVTVTITLTDDAKGFFDAYYANGNFIDGYVYFTCYDGSEVESAHTTFLGFYGDWSAGPILETHDWRELMNVEVDPEYSTNPMDYVDWETNTTPTMAYLIDDEYNPMLYAGDAPFGYPEGGQYSDARIAVSYNTDSAYFTKLLVIPTIIRNARHIIMIARNAETGEIYAVDDTPYCNKTIFDVEEGAFSTYAWFLFDGTNIYSADGEPIADDTQVVMEFYANVPYGEDALGTMSAEEIVANGAQYLQYTVPVVVDGAAPVIESADYNSETGELTVTVTDNQYLAAIYVVDEEGNDLADTQLFADETAGETHIVTFNVGQQEGIFYVAALDYATNESYKVVGNHEHEWSDWVVLEEATCEEEGLQGRMCAICEEIEYEAIPANGHDLKEVAEVPATCEEDGTAAYYQCSVCDKLFADEAGENEIEAPEVIAALDHDWDEGTVTKQPTLVSEGEMTYTCKRDPSHTRTEVIAKLDDCDGGENCPSKDFVDVDRSPESWSHEPIDWAVLMSITNGTTKTTFSPDKACTRAEAVTFLWRAAGCPEPADADSPFSDVTLDKWYAKAVLWAVEQGITNGTSETTFSPCDTCTRAQIVTFLWRMQEQPQAKSSSNFTDVPADAYFAAAVDWAVEQGITNGVSATEFAPDNDCTRAHIVTFLFRCFAD